MNRAAVESEAIARAEALRRERPGLGLPEAVDVVLTEHPELYSESVGITPSKLPTPRREPLKRLSSEAQARAEQIVLAEAHDLQDDDANLSLGAAVDRVLTATPELFAEACGDDAGALTEREHAALKSWRAG